MNNLPYIKRTYDFSLALTECNVLFDYLESLNSSLDGFKELQGPALTTAGIKNLNQPHTWPELGNFIDFMHTTAQEVFGKVKKENYQQNIARSWTNRYWQDSFIEEHNHEGVDLVFSCYVNKPKDSGNLELFYNDKWNTIELETNDVIVFSGRIPHRTQQSKSDEPRVVLAVNTNHFVQPYLEKIKKAGNNLAKAKSISDEYDKFYKKKLDELELKLCLLD
jgi:hypothetical protein